MTDKPSLITVNPDPVEGGKNCKITLDWSGIPSDVTEITIKLNFSPDETIQDVEFKMKRPATGTSGTSGDVAIPKNATSVRISESSGTSEDRMMPVV